MRNSEPTSFLWIIAFSGLLLISCQGQPSTPAFTFTPSSPPVTAEQAPANAAIVNGVPISYNAYERELARFEAGQAALGLQPASDSGYRRQVLDLLVEQELIRQLAASQGIIVSDAAVEAEISSMVALNGEDYFNGWLAGNLYTREEFVEVVRLQLITNQLIEPIKDAVPTRAEHVHALHILVNSEAEAREVLTRLQAGESFAALAAEYSVDITSKDNGGDLGWFPRGGLLVPEVEEAAFSMAPGQISDVIASSWGYHIVQTLEFVPDREIDFETRQRLIKQAIENWQLRLRDGANIQILVSF